MSWLGGGVATGASVLLLAAAPMAHGGGSPEPIHAGELAYRATVSDRRALLSVALPVDRRYQIVEAIESGLRSRVTFDLRLYRRRNGVIRIFGDQLLGEVRISHAASFAPLTGEYLLEVTRRHRGRGTPNVESTVSARYLDTSSFRHALLSVREEVVGRAEVNEQVYLSFRVHLQPVELAAPLHIISMFGRGTHASGWINMPLTAATASHR